MPREPICPQHRCHPNDCFEIHYPESVGTSGAKTEEEIRLEIIRTHIQKQNESIKKQQAKLDRSVVDARKRFEESKERRAKEA